MCIRDSYDAVIEDETDTVIIVEGVFDAIALTRKLNLLATDITNKYSNGSRNR